MELPQPRPQRSGGKKLTHDFLSLYPSPGKQDQKPAQGHLKTHDFLQPLERGEEIQAFDKNAPVFPTEHALQGGIGSYSISQVSYINERVPTREGAVYQLAHQGSSSDQKNGESSNCSSHTTGSAGFTLWDESVLEKGKKVKQNGERSSSVLRETMIKVRQRSSEQVSQPSSSTTRPNFTTFSTSLPAEQKNQSFIDMIKSAKSIIHEAAEESQLNKDFTSCAGEVIVKIEDKSGDQRVSTPRSKHSATEQRRRSKINDRFQMLREIIPHKDHKRDKASFLLEVIEYIRGLQEKVQKYEHPFQGWNLEPPKGLPLRSICRPTECPIRHKNGVSPPSTALPTDNNNASTIPQTVQNPMKSTIRVHNSHPESLKKAEPVSLLQPNISNPLHDSCSRVCVPSIPRCDASKRSQPQPWQNRRCMSDCGVATDKLKEAAEMTIKGGTIRISSLYSRGLLNTLTEAVESWGVDLSQATISVQIELGNRTNAARVESEVPLTNPANLLHSRVSSGSGDSNQSQKKLKISKN